MTAVGIYAVMARDPIDALELIGECDDLEVIRDLNAMVTAPPGPRTDADLNRWFVAPVARRLAQLESLA